jgi:hypothetical protein
VLVAAKRAGASVERTKDIEMAGIPADYRDQLDLRAVIEDIDRTRAQTQYEARMTFAMRAYYLHSANWTRG